MEVERYYEYIFSLKVLYFLVLNNTNTTKRALFLVQILLKVLYLPVTTAKHI
jgi:hypothetical protein